MFIHIIFEGLISPRAYQVRRDRNPNSAGKYQRSFFQHFLFITFLLLARCSALFVPLASSEIKSDELCPSPVDFQETYTSSFHRYFVNNVYVLEILGLENIPDDVNQNNESTLGEKRFQHSKTSKSFGHEPKSIPCKFQVNNFKGTSKVTLVTLQQRKNLVLFDRKCSGILEFPIEWGLRVGVSCETEEVNHSEDKMIVASDGKFEIRITQKKMVKWIEGGRVQFELPYEGSAAHAPYVTALFRLTSPSGDCDLQVQQYYWTNVNDSSKCNSVLKRKLLHHVCGHFDCHQETQIIHELRENAIEMPGATIEDPQDSNQAQMKTIGYFLKGLLVPLLISVSATLGYIIWRKRAKMERLRRLREGMEGSGVSLGTQTQSAALGHLPILDEHGNVNLIELEDDYVGEGGEGARLHPYSQDKPPTYESILLPPTYEQATQPLLQLTKREQGVATGGGTSHFEEMALTSECESPPPPHYLQCTCPEEEFDEDDDDDKCLDVADESRPLT